MTEQEMIERLRQRPAHPAWPVFVSEMQSRSYGPDALRDAWAWFVVGWEARRGPDGNVFVTAAGRVVPIEPAVVMARCQHILGDEQCALPRDHQGMHMSPTRDEY